jgi:hypothetical protein
MNWSRREALAWPAQAAGSRLPALTRPSGGHTDLRISRSARSLDGVEVDAAPCRAAILRVTSFTGTPSRSAAARL